MTRSISYADAGVSIDNANRAVAKIREFARSTFNERTLTEIGSFGGMFAGSFPGMAEPDSGCFGGRCGDEAETGVRDGHPQHGRG